MNSLNSSLVREVSRVIAIGTQGCTGCVSQGGRKEKAIAQRYDSVSGFIYVKGMRLWNRLVGTYYVSQGIKYGKRVSDNYYCDKGIRAGKWGLVKARDLVIGKQTWEIGKRLAPFAWQYLGLNSGNRLRTFMLGVIIVNTIFERYIWDDTFSASRKLYNIMANPEEACVSEEALGKGVEEFVKITFVNIVIRILSEISSNYFYFSLIDASKECYLRKIQENDAFNGIDYISKGDCEISSRLNSSLPQASYAAYSILTRLRSIYFNIVNFVDLIEGNYMLLGIGLVYSLITNRIGIAVAAWNRKLTESEMKVKEESDYRLQQVSLLSESMALRRGGRAEVKRIQELCLKSINYRNLSSLSTMYTSAFRSIDGMVILVVAFYFQRNELLQGEIKVDDVFKKQAEMTQLASMFNEESYYGSSFANVLVAFDRLKELDGYLKEWDELMAKRDMQVVDGDTLAFKGTIKRPGEKKGELELVVEIEESVVFAKGKTIRISGKSGTGKTTLFRTFAGLWPYVEKGVLQMPKKVEFLPQRPYIPCVKATLEEIIQFPREGELSKEQRAEVEAMMKELGLEMALGEELNYDKKLSGGQKQKVALISAVLKAPEYLILDEPTASVEMGDQRKMFEFIRKWLPEVGLIYTDHHPIEIGEEEIVLELVDKKLKERQ